MEIVEITPEKAPKPNKHHLNGAIIGFIVAIAIIEVITGGFLYLRFQDKEQDLKEKEEMLFRQSMSIEFKQMGIKNTRKDLVTYDAELTSLERELKAKEVQLREQKELLDAFRASVRDTVSLLEPKKLAENMLKKYLERYASVDFKRAIPCGPKERALYNTAKINLQALQITGLEISKSNKYTEFVDEQFKFMNNEPVDCLEDLANIVETDVISDEVVLPTSTKQADTELTDTDDDIQEESDTLEEDIAEDEIDDEPAPETVTNTESATQPIIINRKLDAAMERRDSAFKSLED